MQTMMIAVLTLWTILLVTFDTSVFAAMENGLALPEIVYKRTSTVSGGQPKCHTQGKPLDLILIIDSSGSLRTQSDEEFQVIRDIISIVAVSPDATRIALVQYSGVARSEFHFNTFTTRQQILDAVQVINPLFGITKTGNALAQAISELDAEKGMRPSDVPKIGFLISDGRTQDYPDDTNQAARLRSYGVDVWSYGLGEYVAIEELINVTGDANKVVTRKNYPHLKELFEPFKGVEICEKATVCIPGTERPLDLLFLIDSSESVEKKFQDQIDFIRRTLNNVNVHPDAVRVAALLYSGKPVVAFDFRRYHNLEGVKEHLGTLVSRNGTTRTDLALLKATEIFSDKYGARNDSVKKMTIVLTDGHSQVDPSEAILPLSQIKNMDVFAVAVVPLGQVDESELLVIANNEPGRVFTKSNLDQFEFKFKDYVSLSCAGSDIADAGEPTVRGPTDIQCDENSLTLTVRTMLPFVGRLYTLGYENDEQCSTVGQNATTVSIKISTKGKCGVLRSASGAPDPGYVYNVSFMIQFHPNVITRLDQIVLANCFAPSNGALKEAAKDFSPAKKEITCSYILQQYHPENGCAVLDARVGDNVYHKWTCDMGPDHDYIVHNCDAVTDKATIAILDEYGCQVDPNIFETPVYDGKKSFIFRDSWMFKFPGVTWMQFKCKISICSQQNGNCSGVIPPNCGNRRRKREDINSKIVQTLDVETRRINVLVNDELKPIEKLHFCTNFY